MSWQSWYDNQTPYDDDPEYWEEDQEKLEEERQERIDSYLDWKELERIRDEIAEYEKQ